MERNETLVETSKKNKSQKYTHTQQKLDEFASISEFSNWFNSLVLLLLLLLLLVLLLFGALCGLLSHIFMHLMYHMLNKHVMFALLLSIFHMLFRSIPFRSSKIVSQSEFLTHSLNFCHVLSLVFLPSFFRLYIFDLGVFVSLHH